jgi:hypothetical protein
MLDIYNYSKILLSTLLWTVCLSACTPPICCMNKMWIFCHDTWHTMLSIRNLVVAFRNCVLYVLCEIFYTCLNFKRHFTFRGPCIMIYSYYKSQQDALFLNLRSWEIVRLGFYYKNLTDISASTLICCHKSYIFKLHPPAVSDNNSLVDP